MKRIECGFRLAKRAVLDELLARLATLAQCREWWERQLPEHLGFKVNANKLATTDSQTYGPIPRERD